MAKGAGLKLRVAVGSLAAAAAVLSMGTGIASADDLAADPSAVDATGGSGAESRGPAIQGGQRASDIGVVNAQGEVRGSDIAVPVVKGQSPPPGNLADLGYTCLFAWSQFCQ